MQRMHHMGGFTLCGRCALTVGSRLEYPISIYIYIYTAYSFGAYRVVVLYGVSFRYALLLYEDTKYTSTSVTNWPIAPVALRATCVKIHPKTPLKGTFRVFRRIGRHQTALNIAYQTGYFTFRATITI